MMARQRSLRAAALLAGLAAAGLTPLTAKAQISGDTVKIGVLNDMSSIYADSTGAGSVLAAQMAVKDFGGTVAGAASSCSTPPATAAPACDPRPSWAAGEAVRQVGSRTGSSPRTWTTPRPSRWPSSRSPGTRTACC